MKEVTAQLAKKYGVKPEETGSGAVQRFDPYRRGLIRERDETKIELARLQERQQRLTGTMKEHGVRGERAPTREQERMILLRDEDNRQKKYESMLDTTWNARG